jgi:hypothetical protein
MLACGWVGRRRQAGRRQDEKEEEEGRRDGRMEGRRGKVGSPGGEGDQGAGAWAFYEVKSVVR